MATSTIRLAQLIGGINSGVDAEFISLQQAQHLKNFNIDTTSLTKRKGLFKAAAGMTSYCADMVYNIDGKAMAVICNEEGGWYQINKDRYKILPTAGKVLGAAFDRGGCQYRGKYFTVNNKSTLYRGNSCFKLDTVGMLKKIMYINHLTGRLTACDYWGESISNHGVGYFGQGRMLKSDGHYWGTSAGSTNALKHLRTKYCNDAGTRIGLQNEVGTQFGSIPVPHRYCNMNQIYDTTKKYITMTDTQSGHISLYTAGVFESDATASDTWSGSITTASRTCTSSDNTLVYINGNNILSVKWDGTNITAASAMVTVAGIIDMDCVNVSSISNKEYVVLTSDYIYVYNKNDTLADSIECSAGSAKFPDYTLTSIQIINSGMDTNNWHFAIQAIKGTNLYLLLYDYVNGILLSETIIHSYSSAMISSGLWISKDMSEKKWFIVSELYAPPPCLIHNIASGGTADPTDCWRMVWGKANTMDVSPAVKCNRTTENAFAVEIDFSESSAEFVQFGGTGERRGIGTLYASASVSFKSWSAAAPVGGWLASKDFFGINYDHIESHGDRLWFGDGKLLYYTDVESEYVHSENYIYIDDNRAAKITAIKSWHGALFVFTNTSIWRITGYNVDNWTVDVMENDVGCESERTLIGTLGGLIFVNRDGIYSFNGNQAQLISTNINGWIDDSWAEVSINGIAQAYRTFYCLYGKIKGDDNKQLLMFEYMNGVYNMYEFSQNFDQFIVTPESDWHSQMYFVNQTGVYKFGFYDIVKKDHKLNYYGATASTATQAEYLLNSYLDDWTGSAGVTASVAVACEYISPKINFDSPALAKQIDSIDIYVKDSSASFTATLTSTSNDLGIVTETAVNETFILSGSGKKRCINFRPTHNFGTSYVITISNNDMYEFVLYELFINYRFDRKSSV